MIYIIRHGKTELNKANVLQGQSDHPLNEDGIEEAAKAAERLKNVHFSYAFSSPLVRAVKTAGIVVPYLEPVIDERLIEMDYGPYEGSDLKNPAPEIIHFFSDFVNNPSPEGMEQLSHVVSRVGEFMEEIRNLPGNILISTHAIAMKGILEYLTPGSNGSYWSKYIGNCAVYTVDNTNGIYSVPEEYLNKPTFSDENIKSLYDARFLRLYDLQYKEGAHYYDVSRRESSSLVARKSDEEFKTMLPDAVTIAVIVKIADDEPKLLLNYEYRYPVGQYLLSPIAGLIDPADRSKDDPLIEAAKREIFEESGLKVKDSDSIEVINPCAFSSPGMTDESNAFLCARISIDDVSEFSQDGAEGSELFNGYELVGRKEAAEIFRSGRDKYGNFFSIATWVVLSYFLLED